MKDLVSWVTSNLTAKTIVDGLAIVSGVTGIVGFVRDSFSGSQNWPWIFIAIALTVGVYRIWTKQTKLNLMQLLRPKMSMEQALGHLGSESGSSRVNIIQNIAPHLKDNISGQDASKLLGSLSMSNRVEAIRILAPKISATNHEEVKAVLGSLSMSSREEAAYYLANHTSRKLDEKNDKR